MVTIDNQGTVRNLKENLDKLGGRSVRFFAEATRIVKRGDKNSAVVTLTDTAESVGSRLHSLNVGINFIDRVPINVPTGKIVIMGKVNLDTQGFIQGSGINEKVDMVLEESTFRLQ